MDKVLAEWVFSYLAVDFCALGPNPACAGWLVGWLVSWVLFLDLF